MAEISSASCFSAANSASRNESVLQIISVGQDFQKRQESLRKKKRKFLMLHWKQAMTVQMDFSGLSLQSLDVILRNMKNQIFQYSAMFLMTLSTAARIYTKQKVADWIRFRLITARPLIFEKLLNPTAASEIFIRNHFLINCILLELEKPAQNGWTLEQAQVSFQEICISIELILLQQIFRKSSLRLQEIFR